ncbi:MAG: hypothetical protein M1824_001955 [Vezdaea acicularis]|nr:MAG: hypothetical protein M1824_001955 [Vezdaea acicularis]
MHLTSPSLIPQQFTWGPFRISQLALQTLLASHRVFIAFLDLLPTYGLRTHDDQHTWSGFRSSLPIQGSKDADTMHECCYSLRYMEENGRGVGDPWSLRQTAVYHQFHQKNGQSCWIILQIATGMRTRLEQALADKMYRNRRDGVDQVRLHVDFLSAMASNWALYLEYLHDQLSKLDEKACHSRVGKKVPTDYQITFEDCQQLQQLRQKLLRTSRTLDACLDTARGYAEHCHSLIALGLTRLGEQVVAELTTHIRQIQSYRRSVREVIEQSLGTSKLLFKILEFRNDATLSETNGAMHCTLELLRQVAIGSEQNSLVAVDIARQGQHDSKLLKALSTVATIYLPATLTAVCAANSTLA